MDEAQLEILLQGRDAWNGWRDKNPMVEIDLSGANLREANLGKTALLATVFANVDLSQTRGLDSCNHHGPSPIDYLTLAQSGPLPRRFLEGCGLPNHFIDRGKLFYRLVQQAVAIDPVPYKSIIGGTENAASVDHKM